MRARVLLIAAATLAATSAFADLYKCVSKEGKVAYQADPCPSLAQEQRVKAPAAGGAAGPGGVELLEVGQVARRIEGQRGRTTVVLFYGTDCPLSRQMFPEFVEAARKYRSRGIDFLAFSTDDEPTAKDVAPFLARHNAPFSAVVVKPWPEGDFARAMKPVGLEIGRTWTRPLVAIRDTKGSIVYRAEALTDLTRMRSMLDSIAR